MTFVYEALPGKVTFGNGTITQLSAIAAAMGLERALVLCTPSKRALAERAAGLLGDRCVGIHDRALMHVPAATVDAALSAVAMHKADACITLGGGSTIGLAKAIALQTGLPIVAVPTTYSGSEMTPVWGTTKDRIKTTGRDLKVLPKAVIYDPELTYELPANVAGPSGLNAIAHCVEGLYAQNSNPITSLMAEAGIAALAASLPVIVKTPRDAEARYQALYGAWLSGCVLGAVGMALHHKLCHILGGSFNLPHAETHSVILPHAVAYNCQHAPVAMQALARALQVEARDVAGALHDLARLSACPLGLQALGLAEADLDQVADLAARNPYYNPRPLERTALRALLQNAFDGSRPRPTASS